MIPAFPDFKKLELSDKPEVEKFTQKYTPHSDFNFVGMWTWDIDDNRHISTLNENLVAKTTDYVTGEPFYTYLGDNSTSETTERLLELATKEGTIQRLRLISEDSIKNIDHNLFIIEEDRDHFDYILDNEILLEYVGNELRNHAGFKRRFIELHGEGITVRTLKLGEVSAQKSIINLDIAWQKSKMLGQENQEKKGDKESAEDIAIKKMFVIGTKNESIITTGVFQNEKLIAYTIDEIVHDDSIIRHFMKADRTYKGIYSYLVSESARVLLEQGKRYVNLEQDLGLKNLRRSKESYSPVRYHKKYSITKRNS